MNKPSSRNTCLAEISRPLPKNRVSRVPRANGGTPIDAGTIRDDSYVTVTMIPTWSTVSGSQKPFVALLGKSIVKIHDPTKNSNIGISGIVHDRANDISVFDALRNSGRYEIHIHFIFYDFASPLSWSFKFWMLRESMSPFKKRKTPIYNIS